MTKRKSENKNIFFGLTRQLQADEGLACGSYNNDAFIEAESLRTMEMCSGIIAETFAGGVVGGIAGGVVGGIVGGGVGGALGVIVGVIVGMIVGVVLGALVGILSELVREWVDFSCSQSGQALMAAS